MTTSDPKVHWVVGNRTLCGRAAIRYDSAGHMLGSLKATSDPHRVSCVTCWASPHLDPSRRDLLR